MRNVLSVFLIIILLGVSVTHSLAEELHPLTKILLGVAAVGVAWKLLSDDDESSASKQKSEAAILAEEASMHMDKKEFSQAFDKYCRAYKLTYDEDLMGFCKRGMKDAREAREVRGLSANFTCD